MCFIMAQWEWIQFSIAYYLTQINLFKPKWDFCFLCKPVSEPKSQSSSLASLCTVLRTLSSALDATVAGAGVSCCG